MNQQIEVVTSNEPANYPFVVEFKPTENWCAHKASVSLEPAESMAADLKAKNPDLPVRIKHYTGGHVVVQTVPAYEFKTERTQVPRRVAIWSNDDAPPAVNERIELRINCLGKAVVQGYVVICGYLGVMVKLKNPPDWFVRQNGGNVSCVAYGAEIQRLPGCPMEVPFDASVVVDILTRAREILSDESKWCREGFAEMQNSDPVNWASPDACRWCGLGAIRLAYFQLKGKIGLDANLERAELFLDAQANARGFPSFPLMNDSNTITFKDVQDALDAAIAKAVAERDGQKA